MADLMLEYKMHTVPSWYAIVFPGQNKRRKKTWLGIRSVITTTPMVAVPAEASAEATAPAEARATAATVPAEGTATAAVTMGPRRTRRSNDL